jgi:hypothetical protein
MKLLVVIPMTSYKTLLNRCPIESRMYRMLANGIIEGQDGDQVVHILCEEAQADKLYELISSVAPEVLSTIKRAPLPAGI